MVSYADYRATTRWYAPHVSGTVHTLVLLRHGQSEWNLANLFTGWEDVGLSEQGLAEAASAGVVLRDAGIEPDVLHTSLQKRAIHTAEPRSASSTGPGSRYVDRGGSTSGTGTLRGRTRGRPPTSSARTR